jgi:putative oxidoreductase
MTKTSPASGAASRFVNRLVQLPSALAFKAWVSLPLRLIVGYGFMEHGFAKLSRGVDAFPNILHAMGIPLPHVMGLLTIAVEIFGGFAILIGAFVPLVSVPMAIVLVVATFTVHLQYGFSSIKLQAITSAGAHFGQPGYETDMLYLACLAALVIAGPGPFSVDRILVKARRAGSNRCTETDAQE